MAAYSAFTGFYSNSVGCVLFLALWEYLAEQYPQEEPEVDSTFWKMKFCLYDSEELTEGDSQ